METRVRKSERVLNLLAYLLRSRKTVPFEEIRRNVDGYNDPGAGDTAVSRRFERDKKTLRELGLVVEWTDDAVTGVHGYAIPRPGAYMGALELTDREARLLSVLAAFGREKNAPLLANLASACQKLLAGSPLREPVESSAVHHLVYPAKTALNRTLSANLELFALALERRKRVAFTYYSIARDKVSRRTVEPYGLKFFKGEWYLVGRCLRAREERIFRLDRLRGKARMRADGDKPEYDVPSGFSVADYVGRSPWQLSRRDPVTVDVALDEVGAWLVEEAAPAGLKLARKARGTVAVIDVRNEEAFFKWLVPFGTHAKITAPAAVAGAFVEYVRRLAR